MAEKDYNPIFQNTHYKGYHVIFGLPETDGLGGCLKPSCEPMLPQSPTKNEPAHHPLPTMYGSMVLGIVLCDIVGAL